MGDFHKIGIQQSEPFIRPFEEDLRYGLVGIKRPPPRVPHDDGKRILLKIDGLRVRKTVNGPGHRRDIGIHDHDPSSGNENAERLVKKIPDIFQMMQNIEQNDVGQTIATEWQVLRIHERIEPWESDDVGTEDIRRKFLEIPRPSSDFDR